MFYNLQCRIKTTDFHLYIKILYAILCVERFIIMAFDVIGLGSVLIDEIAVLSEFPKEDTKTEIQKLQTQLGGPVPTALKALSKLGLETSFIGKIGTDNNAQKIKRELQNSMIDTSNLSEENAKSGFSQIWIDTNKGTRTIAYSNGNMSELELSPSITPNCKLIHIDGRNHKAAKELILNKNNAIVSIDTGNFREKTLHLIDLVDIAIMPKRFVQAMHDDENTNNLIQNMRKRFPQPKYIIITDGVNGSVCSFENKIIHQKAFQVNTLDSTGAGDIHSAGIIYGVLQNWKLEKTLEFAAAMAAFKCQYLGNSTLASIEEIKAITQTIKRQ